MSDSDESKRGSTPESERPPWYRRAFELFAFHYFDCDSAALLARSEWQQRQRRLSNAT
jgi:hypothetical protein